jgi:hypothetical protein
LCLAIQYFCARGVLRTPRSSSPRFTWRSSTGTACFVRHFFQARPCKLKAQLQHVRTDLFLDTVCHCAELSLASELRACASVPYGCCAQSKHNATKQPLHSTLPIALLLLRPCVHRPGCYCASTPAVKIDLKRAGSSLVSKHKCPRPGGSTLTARTASSPSDAIIMTWLCTPGCAVNCCQCCCVAAAR